MTDGKLWTAEDVSEYLGVPVSTLYKWRVQSKGPRSLKVGKHLRYRRVDVEQWANAQGEPMRRGA